MEVLIIDKNITINKIGNNLWNSNLDSDYLEAFATTRISLNHESDSPLKSYWGTNEKIDDLICSRILTADEISELIHMMMYKMRDDFQYGEFKPIIKKYLKIVKDMRKENHINQNKKEKKKIIKPQCIFSDHTDMFGMIGTASVILKQNNMYKEAIQMVERATLTYDFDEAFKIISEYVEVIERSESFQYEDEEFE